MYKKCEEILNKLESEGKIKISDYQFPQPQKLKLKLKDILESKVDEKYYLSEKMINYILDINNVQKGTKWEGRADNDTLNSEIAHTLSVRGASGNQRAGVNNFVIDDFDKEIQVKEIKFIIGSTQKHIEFPKILDDRDKGWGIKISDVCPTQRANRCGIKCIEKDLRIRKLTPKECWRLMGFDDVDFEKAEKVNSNTQLYKQAGNSICVPVLMAIFKELIK